MSFFDNIFDTSGFPPRWYCGSAWTETLGWTHVISDLVLFSSYVAIPIALIYLIRGRKDFLFIPILWLFVAFILFCGINHLVEATIFWYPWYRFSGLIKLITATISVFTAAVLIKILPQVLTIPHIIKKKADLENLIDNFDIAFFILNQQGKIIFVNKEVITLTGISLPNLKGTTFNDLLPKRLWLNFENFLQEILNSQEDKIQKKFFIVKENKSLAPVEISISLLRKENKISFCLLVKDLTLNRAAGQAQRRQAIQHESLSKRLNAVLNCAGEGIITLSKDGIIESFNKSAEQIFGYPAEEIIGKSAKLISANRKVEKLDKEFETYLKSLVATVANQRTESFGKKRDGTIFPVEYLLSKTLIEGRNKYISSVRDISDRKKIETSLQEAYNQIKSNNENLIAQNKQYESLSNRLNAVLNGTEDGIITISADGVIESFNHSAERIFGYSAEEAIGRIIIEILNPPSHFGPTPVKSVLKNLLTKINLDREELCMRKDGTFFPVEYSLTEVLIEGEMKFIGSVRDISKRKEIESKLHLAYQELEEFVYIASHDLKEPLRGIHNYATFLIEDYADLIDQSGRDKLHTLKSLTVRLDKFIDDLLYYSRIDKTELAIKTVDLNEVINDVIESLRITISEKKISVNLHKLPTLICDKSRISEVFRNLITNAMKYNDKENKLIDIGCDLIETQSEKPIYTFYVRDNGIGIPEKYHQSIFKIFKRLHGRDKFGGGTGAGLTIAQKIVNQHGGKVWARSMPGEGTTFYFTLQEKSAK